MEEKTSILIVDDNISLCETMSLILRHNGYAVTTVHSGPEAIERVREGPFDIIFMDIKMPVMDGVETYRKIEKIRPEALVVMITAYAVKDVIQKELQKRACEIIYKPLDIKNVLTVIEEAKKLKEGAMLRMC